MKNVDEITTKLHASFKEPLQSFLQLEQIPTLKALFDNVRNYFICAAMFALAGWISSKDPIETISAMTITAIGISLALLNWIQTVCILAYFFLLTVFKASNFAEIRPVFGWRTAIALLLIVIAGLFAEILIFVSMKIFLMALSAGGRVT